MYITINLQCNAAWKKLKKNYRVVAQITVDIVRSIGHVVPYFF